MPQTKTTLVYDRKAARSYFGSYISPYLKVAVAALAIVTIYLSGWLYIVSRSTPFIEGNPYRGTWEVRYLDNSYINSRWSLVFAPLERVDRNLRPEFWKKRLSTAEVKALLLPSD